MQKLYTILAALIIVVVTLFYFNYNKDLNYLSIPPENHPEVISVEKMIDKTTAKVPRETKKRIALAIVSNGKFYNIPYKHLVAIAFVESTFRPNLINETGDYGVCQINWFWHGKNYVKHPSDLLNVYKNVEIACKIINENKRMGFDKLASYHSFNRQKQQDYQGRLKIALGRL